MSRDSIDEIIEDCHMNALEYSEMYGTTYTDGDDRENDIRMRVHLVGRVEAVMLHSHAPTVHVGLVRPFPNVKPDKAQVMKIAEEAMEVFSSWEDWSSLPDNMQGFSTRREILLNECADVIQATCNLIAALGVSDFREFMALCEKRNDGRGRY